MITHRDYELLDYLTEFKIASTATITQLFFPSLRSAQIRLASLVEHGHIKRDREGFGTSFIYYIATKPKQLRHCLTLTEFHREAHKTVSIHKLVKEPKLNSMIPDALLLYETGGIQHTAFVEVELSNKGLDVGKYNCADLSRFKGAPPELIVVTNKKVPECRLKTIVIDTHFTNIEQLKGG